MARDDTPQQPDSVADAAGSGLPGPPAAEPEPEPEQVGSGKILVRTRPGYEFHGSTIDVPVTSTGVLVTASQAKEIQDEATLYGEVIYVGTDEQEG